MDQMNFIEIGMKLGIFFVPFLFALCFHEFAHGWVAKLKGDNTAQMSGRLSLNPFVHADPIGTFVLPIAAIVLNSPFFFGWAKPVPVNERNLKRPTRDMFWIALAGPLSNVFLAVVSCIALGAAFGIMKGEVSSGVIQLLRTFIMVNMFLAIFNLIPVHPLDGGKVIAPFLPYEWNRWLENNQDQLSMMLMLALLLVGRVLAIPVDWAVDQLFTLAGIVAHLVG